mgnify:CR=1 FL=1
MINDVKNALNAIVGTATNLQNAAGAGRVFELFVMTGIACALRTRGYDVWLQRSDGTRISPTDSDRRFIQRGGAPSGISGQAKGPNNASSIGFQRGACPKWEILNGIQFRGRSSAKHEIDLAIVPQSVASSLRSNPTGGIPLGRPRVSIECKDVGTNGSVDEMRAFVARLYDLTLLKAHHPYLSVSAQTAQAIHPASPPGPVHRPALTYWIENRRTMNVIARRTGFRSGAAALTGYHAVEPHGGIAAGTVAADKLMDDVAEWILAKGY